jgi:hypothetical protein
MFGFIKNFFGGIFGFFAGLLGLKKSEYFMDLGESGAKEPAKVAPAKAEPVAVAAPAKAEAAKSEKSEPAKKAKVEKKSKQEKQPVASAAAKTSEPPKVPAAATNGKVSSQAQPVLTFAPNNLMPIPTGNRRTPGPSMNNFREMARQVKMK